MQNPRSATIARNLLQNPEVFATTLVVLLLDRFGTEFLEWAPETIRLEIWDAFQAAIPQPNLDKIMAAITILTTDHFFKNLPRFIQLCNVLADDEFNPTIFNPADSMEMAWGITEALLLSPPDEDEPFTDEIRYYIGYVLAEEGIINPPDILQIAKYDNITDPLSVETDDPAMYAGFYQKQQSVGDEIRETLREQLAQLFEQLELVPLQNGDTKDLLKRIKGIALTS